MRIRFVLWIQLVVLLAAGLGAFLPGKVFAKPLQATAQQVMRQQTGVAPVVVLRFEGALHPVMQEHLERAQQIAQREQAQAIILELDTPGGEIQLMNQIVEQIRASQVPIVVYISPRGAMAGSAGTVVTLAGHLSAMAPETAIGAASPVGPNGEDIGTTMESKVKEMLKANVRTLAANRPPEAIRLAEDMIDKARAVSTDEAMKAGLVDVKANNIQDLLKQLDGRQVKIGDQTRTLHTAGAEVMEVNMTFMEEMLKVLANPNIAFLLLAVGVQAILIEISSPGGWVAGFIGAVCLLLATYGMGLLPVNWFGLLFLALAFALFILDIKAPTHGALTTAGVASFIVGALVLFNSPNVPSFQRVSVPLVIGTGLTLGLFFFVIVGFALRAQKTPLRMGGGLMLLGQVGVVNTPLNPVGTVQLGSELWTAVAEDGGQPVPRGSRVEVIGMDRLQIRVRKVDEK
jgi:membrane-bound serine protease (ClpP class)